MPGPDEQGRQRLPKVVIANATKFRNLGIALIFFSIVSAVVGISVACLALMQMVTEPIGYIGLGASAVSAIIANVSLSFILCLLESPDDGSFEILHSVDSASRSHSELVLPGPSHYFNETQPLPVPRELGNQEPPLDSAAILSRVVDLLACRPRPPPDSGQASVSQSCESVDIIPDPEQEENVEATSETESKCSAQKSD